MLVALHPNQQGCHPKIVGSIAEKIKNDKTLYPIIGLHQETAKQNLYNASTQQSYYGYCQVLFPQASRIMGLDSLSRLQRKFKPSQNQLPKLQAQNPFNYSSPAIMQFLQDYGEPSNGKIQSVIIKLKTKNLPKLAVHHLLLDMIDIIYRGFLQKLTLCVNICQKTSFLQNQSIEIIISEAQPQVLYDFISHLNSKNIFIFLQPQLSVNQRGRYESKVSISQLQFAIYKSLSSIDKGMEQFSMLSKLRYVFSQLICPHFFFINEFKLRLINQLLVQVISQIEIYDWECKRLLIKITRLLEHNLFNVQSNLINVQFAELKQTVHFITKRLGITSIEIAYEQFAKFIGIGTGKSIKKNYTEDFLRLYRIFTSLMPQQTKQAIGQYLSRYIQSDSKFIDMFQKQFGTSESQTILRNSQIALKYCRLLDKNKSKMSTCFFSSIQKQKELPNNSCLTCSPFFYLDHRLTQSSQSTIPVKTFQNVEKFKQIQPKILPIVVNFLNHGGGFVAFGVSYKLMDQKVIGNRLSEERKKLIAQQIQTSFQNNIKSLSKSPAFIEVDFAPVCQNPNKDEACRYVIKENKEVERRFLENTYVTRIKICPSSSSEVYYLKNSQQPKFFEFEKGIVKELNRKQIIRLIKWKMKTFLRNQQNSIMTTLPQNLFGHQCKRFEHSSERFQKGVQKQLTISNPKQFQYQEMCLLVARQKDLPLIKRKMLDKGFRCSIQLKFIDKKFFSTKHTSVLYIDLQLQRIIKEICFSPIFQIRQKALLAIQIGKHVKLDCKNEQNRVTVQQFRNIQSWIKSDYQQQVIQLYEYRVGNRKQYYFQARSKTASLYTFYLLQHLSYRSSFKQPKGLDRLPKEQRQNIWIRLYGDG